MIDLKLKKVVKKEEEKDEGILLLFTLFIPLKDMIMMFNIIEGPTTLPLNSSKSSNVYYYEACSPCLQLN